MKARKYITEFGLNVYTSFKTIVPVEHLHTINDGHKYHIYMIMSAPKIIYDNKSIIKYKDKINVDLLRIESGQSELVKINGIFIDKELDHNLTEIKCPYPYDNIEVTIMDEDWLDKKRGSKEHISIALNAQAAMNHFSYTFDKWEFDVLYVGQAFGTDGERIATDRLKSHSTLQKILADYYSLHPDKRIFIFLLEFSPILRTSMDGLSTKFTATEEEEDNHFVEVFNNPLRKNQIINITEAAIINYFKPPYNIKFVENFPNKNHKGYTQYFDLDYNSIVVEFDLDFDMRQYIQLYTETNRINSSFDYISYNLFNDPNRKNMHEIFKET